MREIGNKKCASQLTINYIFASIYGGAITFTMLKQAEIIPN